MAHRTVFYSWQSDVRSAACRTLIEAALRHAIDALQTEGLELVPAVDRDTQGVAGAPDIVDTILAKIDAASVFVADVTTVGRIDSERPVPNPNVLIELGYALKRLGWNRVVLVQNTALGGPETLPFDLRQKRTLTYQSAPDGGDRASARKHLQRSLQEALREILKSPGPIPEPSLHLQERAMLRGRLEDANARRDQLAQAQEPTEEIDNEILNLRRAQREVGAPKRGDKLADRYLLLRQIGEGGFATVWAAEDTDKRSVAVKVMHPHLRNNTHARERFFRGAAIQQNLRHERVVPIEFISDQDDPVAFFVMTLLARQDLERVVTGHSFSRPELVAALIDAADALHAAHSAGLTHRDVKPANVLVHCGRGYLSDFDLVWNPGTTGGTRTGALGSAVYAAPEMLLRPQTASQAADVYSLAMTILFALRGDTVDIYETGSVDAALAEIDCTEDLRTALRDALNRRVENRLQTVAPLRHALSRTTEPSQEVAGEHVLLWYRRGHVPETVWLRQSDADHEVLGRRSGVLVSDGAAVFVWQASEIPVEFSQWSQDQPGDPAGPGIAGHISDTRLVDIITGEVIRFQGARGAAASFWSDDHRDWNQYARYSRYVAPTCSVGRLLFLREDVWGLGTGGPHGSGGATFQVIDLRRRCAIEWIQPDERRELDVDGQQFCLDALNSDPEFEPMLDELEPELRALELAFTATGSLTCGYRYVVVDSYVTGDGLWGDYTRSVIFTPGVLPELLKPYEALPDAALQYLRRFPSWPDAVGWTTLPSGMEERRRVLDAFRSKGNAWEV